VTGLRLVAFALAAALPPAHGAPENFTIDPAHTMPHFEVSHLGISTQRGRFERTRGHIALDREAGAGSILIEIDAASATTGSPMLDATLRGEDFFDVEHFPRLVFKAERLAFDSGSPVRAEGELILLGVTRPVTLQIRHFACTRKPLLVRTTCGADIVAAISRSAFGMKSYAAWIGDEVRLLIQVEAVRQEPIPEPPLPGA
jgi:polyisoprenoid-binding protein YceI